MAIGLAASTSNAVLDWLVNAGDPVARTSVWIQLHTADPGAAGTTAVAGNNVRKDVTAVFSPAASGAVTNDVAVSWASVSTSEDYTHYSLWSASTLGTFYLSGTITANPVTAGDTFTLNIGDIDLTLTTAA